MGLGMRKSNMLPRQQSMGLWVHAVERGKGGAGQVESVAIATLAASKCVSPLCLTNTSIRLLG